MVVAVSGCVSYDLVPFILYGFIFRILCTAEGHLKIMPLHVNCYRNNPRAVELLLRAGSSVNAVIHTESGEEVTALDIALSLKHNEVAQILKSRGGLTLRELFEGQWCSSVCMQM